MFSVPQKCYSNGKLWIMLVGLLAVLQKFLLETINSCCVSSRNSLVKLKRYSRAHTYRLDRLENAQFADGQVTLSEGVFIPRNPRPLSLALLADARSGIALPIGACRGMPSETLPRLSISLQNPILKNGCAEFHMSISASISAPRTPCVIWT